MTLSAPMKDFLWRLLVVLVVVAILLALFYPFPSKAAGTTANVDWTLPTEYSDGSALSASDIASVTVKWSGQVTGQKVVTGAATGTTVPIPCGNVSFTVFVTPKPTAKFPVPSAETVAVPYATGVVCRPNPPTAVTAT